MKGVIFLSQTKLLLKRKDKIMKKKRILSCIMGLVFAISAIFTTTVFAKDITVKINGNEIYFDQPPVIRNGRTLVPVRAIFEAMGATVLWDNENQIVNVATDFGMMTLGIGSNFISYRNETEDRSIVTDVPPQIINKRTLVPLRAIAECTGYNVEWNESTQTVLITGEMGGLTLPEVDVKGYYAGTKTPDFGVCFDIACAKEENGAYTYNGVSGKQVVEYIETHLAGSGFLIDTENEVFGMFIFNLSNKDTEECVRISYSKGDKVLFVTLSKG